MAFIVAERNERMAPFSRKNKFRIAVASAVVGLGTAIAAPGISVQQNKVEATVEAAAIHQEHSISEVNSRMYVSSNYGLNTANNLSGRMLENMGDMSYLADRNATYNEGDTEDELSIMALDKSSEDSMDEENIEDIEDIGDPTEEITEEEPVEDEEPAPSIYSIGVRHSSVMDIQQRLMDLGFMEYSEPSNYYGSITSEAVMMFQRQQDIKQDGILGPETYALLMSDDAKHYAAKLEMEGSDIKRIQQRLYEMGYLASSNQVTGYFGDVTESAVKKMQENNGLSADGKVGQQTVELLYSDEAKPNLLMYGEKSDIVLEAQKRLKQLGYLTTTPDGEYGNDTLIAVKQFQSRNDLVVDGFLGPSTREVLNSSSAVQNGIMLGDSGDAVKRVQELLNKYGYLSSGNTTGYFGEVTDAAVKSFQKNNGLSADGNVGVMTMSKLTGDNVVKASSSSSSSSASTSSSGSSSSSSSSSSSGSSSKPGSSSTSSGSGTTVSGSVSALISVAKSKVGSPYVLGAKGPNSFDCSGFIYYCLNQVGVKQSYLTSYGWRNVGKYKRVSRLSDVRAGDIIVVTGHVGIAAGNGMVIDASSSSGKIVYRALNSWWSSRFIVAWRIFD